MLERTAPERGFCGGVIIEDVLQDSEIRFRIECTGAIVKVGDWRED